MFEHPTKQTFAAIQKQRFENAIDSEELSDELKEKIDPEMEIKKQLILICPTCGQFFFNCICHILI